jgi:hypothetical protein
MREGETSVTAMRRIRGDAGLVSILSSCHRYVISSQRRVESHQISIQTSMHDRRKDAIDLQSFFRSIETEARRPTVGKGVILLVSEQKYELSLSLPCLSISIPHVEHVHPPQRSWSQFFGILTVGGFAPHAGPVCLLRASTPRMITS